MKETWKTILKHKDYQVSNLGKVRSLKFNKKKILKFGTSRCGYHYILFHKNGYQKPGYIGDLVLTTFIGFRPKNKEVSHINGIKTDNRLCNLKWETRDKNVFRIHGTKNFRFKAFDWYITITFRRKT